MTNGTDELMKRAMASELGIEGIEDPAELKSVFEAKWATMNSADRAAFEMRLGQLTTEAAAGGAPSRWSRIIAPVLLASVGWIVWKPFFFLLILFAVAGVARRFAIRNALFWIAKAAIIVGLTYGCFVAILMKVAMSITGAGMVGSVAWAAVGLMGAAYVGHGVEINRILQTREDEMRIATQGIAIGSYLVTLLVWLAVARLLG
jgi:hypothetical protein